MKKGLSLHLGLNYVDPKHYDGWDGELFACELDAKDMTALAKAQGFKPKTLLRKEVTAKNVKAEILKAAKALKSGDLFFLTYSGHGGQVPDTNGDEGRFGDTKDGMDETWCLFDREFSDDELAALYAQFKAGVRILVLSDSCHSGTVTRAARPLPRARVRLLPPAKAMDVYLKNKAIYDAIQRGLSGAEQLDIKATVLLISGCQDRQLSRDGDLNGAFTGNLKTVWDEGNFAGNYRNFRDRINTLMAEDQTPNYFVIGAPNKAFENEIPFTIGALVKRGGKKIPPGRTPEATPATSIAFVLRELEIMGINQPKPTTVIKKFFAECEKIDRELGLDFTRTDLFRERFLKAFDGVALGKSDLLKGGYATAQEIADLAG